MADKDIWGSFGRALGAEPREQTIIRGASGIDHRLLSLSVDDENRRIILVSADPDPRITAMMHVDVQATLPGTKVLVARPVVVDLGVLARHFAKVFGREQFRADFIKKRFENFNKLPEVRRQRYTEQYVEQLKPYYKLAFANATVPTFSQFFSALNQAVYFDWESIIRTKGPEDSNPMISLKPLMSLDSMKMDRDHGICSVPLYEFSEADWELFLSGTRRDDIRERMSVLGIVQYFYPPPDQVALGLVDRGIETPDQIKEAVKLAPSLGHPYGKTELVGEGTKLVDMIDALRDRDLIVEGEWGMNLTKTGSTARATIKFRPRESFVTKIINRLKITLSATPSDFN